MCLYIIQSSGKTRSSACHQQAVRGTVEMAQRISGKKYFLLAINNEHAALKSECHEEGLYYAFFLLLSNRLLLG